MKAIKSMLMKERKLLEKIMKEAEERLSTAPQGHLCIRKKKRAEYYYKSHETSADGRYMRKDEFGLVKKLVQKDYDLCLLRCVTARIKAINVFLKIYDETCIKKLYEKLNPYRRELLDTAILSDEEYVKRWQAVEYKGKAFEVDAPEIITERGERVRSKSEKIIADKLYMLGIPYRYEYPILLDGNVKVYPDFTILRLPEREEVYLEHLGMMDDSDYANKAMYKLNTYERNGIYMGINLFLTYETSKKPLNTRALDGLIRKLFYVE